MPSIYLILGLSFLLVLLVTYSVLTVSSKQVARARTRYKIQSKFQHDSHTQDMP
jgi:hypothetical protein